MASSGCSDPTFPRSMAQANALYARWARSAPHTVSTGLWSADDRQETTSAIARAQAIVDRAIAELADLAPTLDDCGAAFDLTTFAATTADAFNDLVLPYDVACDLFDDDHPSGTPDASPRGPVQHSEL
jgi:hypothetical protein